MLTEEQALESVDPALTEEQRVQAAQRLMAGAAAYDAYLNSRDPLEAIIAKASGAGDIPTHAALNSEAVTGGTSTAAVDTAKAGAIEATAVEDTAGKAEHDAELAAARERVAELERN